VKALVAGDIQDQGGLHEFDKSHPHALDEILSNKEGERKDLFRPYRKGSDKCRQVTNLVQHWKNKCSSDQFLEEVVIPLVLKKTEQENTHHSHAPSDQDFDFEAFRSEPSGNKPKTTSTNSNSKSTMSKKNSLGKRLIVGLPKGLIFIVVWVDSKLSNLDVIISEDGFSVKQKSKKPYPKNASNLLSHYTWSADEENVVVSTVDDIIDNLKDPKDQWTESEIVALEDEVIRSFVDHRGRPTNHIGYNTDDDGRQIVTFFLKTVKAHQTIPSKGKFTNNGPSGMDVGDDGGSDGGSMFEETVDDTEEVRAEFDAKISDLADRMANAMGDHMRQSQKQMQDMMAFFQQNMVHQNIKQQQQQQQQQQQFPSQNPVPDGVPSRQQSNFPDL